MNCSPRLTGSWDEERRRDQTVLVSKEAIMSLHTAVRCLFHPREGKQGRPRTDELSPHPAEVTAAL